MSAAPSRPRKRVKSPVPFWLHHKTFTMFVPKHPTQVICCQVPSGKRSSAGLKAHVTQNDILIGMHAAAAAWLWLTNVEQ